MRSKRFILRNLHSAIRIIQIRHSAFHISHSMRYLSLGQQKVLFGLALFLLVIIYFQFYDPFPSSIPEENVREFVIEVVGEVRNPGVYIFQNPATLKEAIEKTGGFKEPAQFDKGSSSEVLETGTLLTVTKESSVIPPFPPHSSPLPYEERAQGEGLLLKGENGGIKRDEIKIRISRMAANKLLIFSIPLDLNRVTAEDLSLIPGIGESLAREIVAYRKRRKGFRSVEELKNVKGIGEKTYQAFKTFFIIKP